MNIDPRLHGSTSGGNRGSASGSKASSASKVAGDHDTLGDDGGAAETQDGHSSADDHHAYPQDPSAYQLLKTLPPSALPPNLAASAHQLQNSQRAGPSPFTSHLYTPDHPSHLTHSSAAHLGGPSDLHDGDDGEHAFALAGGDEDDGIDTLANEGAGHDSMGNEDRNPPRRRRLEASSIDDWTRLRKDNHKEVERRRRSNINAGINELSHIIPQSGTGDKAKGAILQRAIQYIQQLKEAEQRNIEKWTLEKLLMDQAMAEMQAQSEEVRRLYEHEAKRCELLESELAALKESEDSEVGVKRQRLT